MRNDNTRLQLNYVIDSDLMVDIVDTLGTALGKQLISDFNNIEQYGVPILAACPAKNDTSSRSRYDEYESAIVSLYLSLAEISSIEL